MDTHSRKEIRHETSSRGGQVSTAFKAEHDKGRSLQTGGVEGSQHKDRVQNAVQDKAQHFSNYPCSSESDLSLRQWALAEADSGNRETAIELFTELIERNPDNALDYNNRGLVYFQDGQHARAIADYNKASELNPNLDSVYNNRANYYAYHGHLIEAVIDYDRAIDINPHNIRAWINQGITFRDLEMYDLALESFEMALNFDQFEGHIYAERGRIHHLRGDWNCAIADYNQAIAHLPYSINHLTKPAARLRLQVELWLDDLLSPLGL